MAIGQTDSLTEIKARIQAQQQECQQAINEARKELEGEQEKSAQLQVAMAGQRFDLRTWQTLHRERTMNVKLAQHDLEHVKGTSFEQSRRERLAAATSALEKSQSEVASLTAALETATLESGRLQEQCQALAGKLDELTARQAELQATYARFHQEEGEHLQAQLVAQLQACDNEIATAAATLEFLQGKREEIQQQVAPALAPFGDLAVHTLMEHGIFPGEDAAPAIVAAQRALVEAKDYQAQAERSRAQSGDDVLPTIMSARLRVNALLDAIDTARRQYREQQAMALLRQMAQPAPMPDDLALAQALAQSLAHVEVVVEEAPAQGPKKQRYAPQSGTRAFAPAGAVPTVSPSLLNPQVKQNS